MAGLINFNPNPLSMGLMNAGANMMMIGGPSRQRVNLGSALGGGMQGLLSGFTAQQQQELENQYKQDLINQRAQEFDLDQRYKMAQLETMNNPAKGATPGIGFYPKGSKEGTLAGMKGVFTPNGDFIPSRTAMSEYQAIMTDPYQVAKIARERAAAAEAEKVRDIRTGPEGAQEFVRTGDLTGLMPSLIQVESSGNPNAVSPVGAQGLTQLMPNTAKALTGGKTGAELPPSEQILVGAKHLADAVRANGEDYAKGVEVYNLGQGNYNKGMRNPGYVKKVLGGMRPQTMAEAESIKTDEALRQKQEEKKIEQASVAPEQLAQLDIAESKLNDAIAALEPGQEVDKLTGIPKKFGFNTGGFMGGSGLVPNKFFDMTNNPNYRTLQSTAASEELKNAAQFLKNQGAVSEGERRLLAEMVQLSPDKNRPEELYKKYSQALKIVRKYKNLWRGRTTQGATGDWSDSTPIQQPNGDIFSQADAIIGGQ